MSDVSGTGRYVWMHGFVLGNTNWGFSIWEMRVYGIEMGNILKVVSCDAGTAINVGPGPGLHQWKGRYIHEHLSFICTSSDI